MTAVHNHAHRRNDSGISVHSFIDQDRPPSPMLTNPDLLLPRSSWQHEPSSTHEPDLTLTPTVSATSSQRNSGGTTELGVATAVFMPATRIVVRPPAPIQVPTNRPTTPTKGLYSGYEHGAPLSDIYEESEATPKSSRFGHRSPSPNPAASQIIEKPPSPSPRNSGPILRHKKRLSSMSNSSAGSDVGDWENFDSSKGMSDRVAADIARMKKEDSGDNEDASSRRQSREEEELTILNARAERILENARKRLTHMEDNLKSARTSVLMPSRSSPHLGEHQPVGGLYRSISAAGATRLSKSKPLFPPLRNPQLLHHNRGISDITANKMPKAPETRSASALEYGTPYLFTTSPEVNNQPQPKIQPSPTSSRSYNSPLRPLEEEEKKLPSTAETTPEVVKIAPPRGLGIHKSASISRENLNEPFERPSSRRTPTPTHLNRSSSSASTRSAKELKEQMSDLKNRIADLKSQAQADHLRRRSLQSLRTPSPFGSGQPDQWYSSSPAYQDAKSSPVNANAGVGWSKQANKAHLKSQSLDGPIDAKNKFLTPVNQRFLDVLSPSTESVLQSSARTDRNTPSLSRPRNVEDDSIAAELDEQDAESIAQLSQQEEENAHRNKANDEYGEDELIAENEEEQIYLNEVLEESLRDAEVEPEVPMIPASYLENSDLMSAAEAERHEDRLDAFDYENMFLHSAMGTYTGKSLNGSVSGSDSDGSDGSDADEDDQNDEHSDIDEEDGDDEDNESIETSRQDNKTPTPRLQADEDIDDSEPSTDDEMEDIITGKKSPGFSIKGTPKMNNLQPSRRQLGSPPQMDLPMPPKKPWMKKTRSDSMDSVSTAATFETATEGENYSEDDAQPDEILNWSPDQRNLSPYHNKEQLKYHNPVVRPRQHMAMHTRYPSSVTNGGRDTPSSVSTVTQHHGMPSTTKHSRQSTFSSDSTSIGIRNVNGISGLGPGLGLGVIGAENAQYINDNGVPERFQGQPSPKHSNIPKHSPSNSQSSTTSLPRKSALKPSKPSHTRNYSAGQPFTPVLPAPSSPQRKIVVNQSFRSPPQEQLPARSEMQAARHSPAQSQRSASSKSTPASQQNHFRSQPQQSSQSRMQSTKSTPSPLAPAMPLSQPVSRLPQPPSQQVMMPNTEILMESLIKLADPTFSLAEGTRFADIDKELVLGLLRAVGGVCDGVLRAEKDVREKRADHTAVREFRGRLEGARGVLEGRWKVSGQRVAEQVTAGLGEDDENGEFANGGMF